MPEGQAGQRGERDPVSKRRCWCRIQGVSCEGLDVSIWTSLRGSPVDRLWEERGKSKFDEKVLDGLSRNWTVYKIRMTAVR